MKKSYFTSFISKVKLISSIHFIFTFAGFLKHLHTIWLCEYMELFLGFSFSYFGCFQIKMHAEPHIYLINKCM